MPSNMFAKITPLLKERKFDIDVMEVQKFLCHYRAGQWIYPDAMYKSLRLDYKVIYDILEFCAEMDVLERNVRLLCPICHRYSGPFYKTLMDIPSELGCNYDDQIIEDPQKHMRVVYKVRDI